MTEAECEVVADAGIRLDELRMRLLEPENLTDRQFRALALDVSKVYGLLSCLPLEVEAA